MNLHRIDLNLLVVLEAIYTEGGITRAAERLNVTQPAVSYALGRLRELLNDPLFVREGHTMVPTPFTRNMIEPLRQSLRSIEATLSESKDFDPAVSERRFTLGCRDVLEARILPHLMKRVAAAAPGVQIATVQFRRRETKNDLVSGRLDVLLDVVLPMSRHIRHTRISRDRYAVVARRDHPDIQGGLDLDTYLKQGHIMVSSRPTGLGVEDFELSRRGLQRNVQLRCQHYYAALRVVAETDLIVTMPELLARVMNQHTGHQVLPYPLEAPHHNVHMCWHANMDNDPANRWLREQVMQAVAESQSPA